MVDGHEDLAWNALTFDRDYLQPAWATRQREAGGAVPSQNGQATLGFAEWILGRIAVVCATLFASPLRRKAGRWDTLCYAAPAQAQEIYRRELEYYRRWVGDSQGRLLLIATRGDLEAIRAAWREEDLTRRKVGLVLLMEGAEGILDPGEAETWYEGGLRILGPAWAGNQYCGGTREPGPLTPEGYQLLKAMDPLHMILDLSHMAEQSVREALEVYPGPVAASHSNARALLQGSAWPDRHLSAEMIRALAERGGVMGLVLGNAFLKGGWTPADGKQAVSLERLCDQVDYVCQLIGNSQRVALGSDLDGGFGLEAIPREIDTAADLLKLDRRLQDRGFPEVDRRNILGGNWLRLLRLALP
ncbi:MAG: membrane dipeptidase [Anaerolineales bacterium]